VESPVVEGNRIPLYDAKLVLDTEMVRVLLDRGADPNERYVGRVPESMNYCTVWEAFLHRSYRQKQLKQVDYDYATPKQIFETAEMFIRYGADLNLRCVEHITGEVSPSDILKDILRPSQYEQIAALIAEKQAAKEACHTKRRRKGRLGKSTSR